VVLYAPGESHDQQMKSAGEDLCVHLEFPAMNGERLRGGVYLPQVENPLVVAEIEALATLPLPAERHRQLALDHQATAVLLTLMAQAFERPAREAAAEIRVRRAEEFIKAHFATIETLGEVAAHAGVGPDHMRHLFQASRGRTLVRYLNEVRVARAGALLVHSSLEIKEIARQCGFRDVYYFSTVFRRLRRVSPGQYRKRHMHAPSPALGSARVPKARSDSGAA
jgi:AraC-like DNA-binding protein